MSHPFAAYAKTYGVVTALEANLHAGLTHFWKTAGTILDQGPVRLTPPDASTFSLSRNFFSTLFLYSYYRAGIPSERRALYAAVNQCLRGMVTGCDNLLDDEYKTTLETDLPSQAHRFRSVLDIMVADRVLFAVLQDFCKTHRYADDLPLKASAASLQALTLSGVQEASEEGGIGEADERLTPDDVLRQVHHYKTGVLFQSTWTIPTIIETAAAPTRSDAPGCEQAKRQAAQEALHRIGIGCQLLDDIVDLYVDVREQRHNYVASAIVHQESSALREAMLIGANASQPVEQFYAACPAFASQMKTEAVATLENGLRQLFLEEHQDLVGPATRFIAGRIGVTID